MLKTVSNVFNANVSDGMRSVCLITSQKLTKNHGPQLGPIMPKGGALCHCIIKLQAKYIPDVKSDFRRFCVQKAIWRRALPGPAYAERLIRFFGQDFDYHKDTGGKGREMAEMNGIWQRWHRVSGSRVTGSPGQRFWPGRFGSRVSVSDPVFDPVLSFNMRIYRDIFTLSQKMSRL